MIVRAPRPQGNFYLLDKTISEDRRLSWAARGMLVFLLGKPDHWQVSPAALINETADSFKPLGRDGVWSLLKELIAAGYCTRTPMRAADGTLAGMAYHISETPRTDLPCTAQPGTAQPGTANPLQVSIEEKARTEEEARIDMPKLRKKRETAQRIPEPTFDKLSGKFSGIPDSLIESLTQANPGVNVHNEITRASCWLLANPERQKVRYLRFLTNWVNNAAKRMAPANRPMTERDATRSNWIAENRAAMERINQRHKGHSDDTNTFDA